MCHALVDKVSRRLVVIDEITLADVRPFVSYSDIQLTNERIVDTSFPLPFDKHNSWLRRRAQLCARVLFLYSLSLASAPTKNRTFGENKYRP